MTAAARMITSLIQEMQDSSIWQQERLQEGEKQLRRQQQQQQKQQLQLQQQQEQHQLDMQEVREAMTVYADRRRRNYVWYVFPVLQGFAMLVIVITITTTDTTSITSDTSYLPLLYHLSYTRLHHGAAHPAWPLQVRAHTAREVG